MTSNQADVATLFLESSRHTLLELYLPRLRECVGPLTDAQVWWRPNDACNSIGNLLLHLNGNVRQWIVASFNRLEDNRNRPVEFAERELIPASVLLDRLGATLQQVSDVLARLTPDDLVAQYEIQGYNVTGLRAVYHVVDHFAIHYGQILYIVKTLNGADLGFYKELNKTGRHS
ncbi:MAG: DUF1572 family protein [Terracidiphilus sp.]|jgi:hypothetical protein